MDAAEQVKETGRLARDRGQQEMLGHVYWLGGAPGAGKSTMARRLAAEFGFRLYGTDDAMQAHVGRTTPAESPFLTKFLSMSMDERWLHRAPTTMLDTFPWLRGEGFPLIVADLLAMSGEQRVIAEGFRLLPRLVAPLLADRRKALWLLPTPAFARMAFEARGATWEIAGKTSDPVRARENLAERDRLFTDRLREETKRLGLATLELDLPMTEDEVVAKVSHAFEL